MPPPPSPASTAPSIPSAAVTAAANDQPSTLLLLNRTCVGPGADAHTVHHAAPTTTNHHDIDALLPRPTIPTPTVHHPLAAAHDQPSPCSPTQTFDSRILPPAVAVHTVPNRWQAPPHFHHKTPQEQLEIWMDYHADQFDTPNKPHHTYIARILLDSGLTYNDVCDYHQFTHIKWDDTTNQYDLFHFNHISIPSLSQKAHRRFPPAATRATSTSPEIVHIHASHTGPVGNITSILQQGRLLPSTLHFSHNPGFFAQGVRITQQLQHDTSEQARIFYNAWNMAKNTHSVLLSLAAWRAGTKFTRGGEEHAMTLLQQSHRAVFHANARCWVIHPHNAIVKGLVWSANATPPET